MEIDLLHGLVLLVIGFAAGTFGIIVGAGGGFLFVPALLIFLRLPPPVAAGTGLLVVFVNALSGLSGYIRQKRVSYRLALWLSLGAVPGTFIGVWLAETGSSDVFYTVFACMLVGLGVFLAVKKAPPSKAAAAGENARTGQRPLYQVDGDGDDIAPPQLLGIGLMLGVVSSYFGIGGGWLLVPILVYLFRIRPHVATATSIFALFLYSSIGAVLYILRGNVDWMAFIWGGAGVILGAQLGVWLSARISGQRIIQILALVLIGTGIKLFFTG